MDFDIVNPLEIPNWDDLILAIGNASFFYSSSWARVLHEAYGYKPVYFTSFENGRISSLMPFMEVRSWLTGKRGVSLPFTDFCDSVARTEEIFREAVDAARKHGREMGWKTLEWRGSGGCFGNGSPSSAYYTHTIDLADG